MAAAKAGRTSNNDNGDAMTQRRNNANKANGDADTGEDDANEDKDKEDGSGSRRTTNWQICLPTLLLCFNDAVFIFVVVVIN